ncbi:LysR family transcriptional regulator [Anaerobium acetethylicum]|uniref:DNA-binding transcriptional regulator, LysR family n=1 Tax=Anaerobium acetethylicum TaxID=1619234 RepID=A0A1D3TX55_9FIRM|nr:LysR family transcriptional regulator [Anaerobium acetethylicum]SCP98900.1 DNA-binding transcriptional regulator, LysR family [Anaerobium acetethylicum]
MELKQLEYIVKIAEENNITHASEKLYITQSALNQQLLKLEKELGTELFHRSRTNWHPTEAGEIYLETAREILALKKNAYNRIFDLTNRKKGYLSIGFTPNRGSTMFSAIYPNFHKKYPAIVIEPKELSVSQQLELIERHALDIGFLTLPEKQRKPTLSYKLICREEIYLATPSSMDFTSCTSRIPGYDFPVLPLKYLSEQSFVLMYKESTILSVINDLFRNAGFKPTTLFETSSTNTILSMIRAGLCCGLIPAHYVDKTDSNISFYSLPERPGWEIVSCYSKTAYTSQAAEDFISLASKYWKTKM